jgi:hypothetical protein
MSAERYRQNAAEALDRAVQARKSEDIDAWFSIAEEWLKLAVELERQHPEKSWSAGPPTARMFVN